MKPVRLPRLRCALLGLLPLQARDGARLVASVGAARPVDAAAVCLTGAARPRVRRVSLLGRAQS